MEVGTTINHIALIPDGNRRWARERGLKPWDGHEAGANKVEEFLRWAFVERGIPTVSIYALSTENLVRRSKEELEHLVDVYIRYFTKMAKSDLVHNNMVRVNILGPIEILPRKLVDILKGVMEATKNYSQHFANFLMPYGGRHEILETTKRIVKDVVSGKLDLAGLTEKVYSSYLFTAGFPDPDLIVRTAERRLSNFLLWQTAYSEVYFFDKYWPDFSKEDFDFIMEDFPRRQRRFGR